VRVRNGEFMLLENGVACRPSSGFHEIAVVIA